MSLPDPSLSPSFPPTRWSLILDLQSRDEKSSSGALAELCRLYWYPVYAFIRKQGAGPEDAQDLTQGFFARLLERGDLLSVEQDRGKLRTYLLGAVKKHLVQDWRHRSAQKRGGSESPLSLDAATAEHRYAQEPLDLASPDALFDRRWALDTMEEALREVEQEYLNAGKADIHTALQPYLSAKPKRLEIAKLAERFGITENSVHVIIHRMRQRFRKSLQRLVAETVRSAEDAEGELRHLLSLLSVS